MTTDWLSGGFIIALAAVLWLVYLVPSWFRSRQYLATERNAVRLQQTLRILAETSEVPEEVRVEASARAIAEQERILKHHVIERETDAIPSAVRTADRLRRSRAVTAGVFAVAVAVAVLGGMQLAYTGTWVILAAGAVTSVVCLAVLVRLSRAGRRLRLPRPVALVSPEFVDHAEPLAEVSADAEADADEAAVTAAPNATGWVPVAVPRPLYLARAALPPLDSYDEDATPATSAAAASPLAADSASADAESAHRESLRRAAAEAELNLRARLDAEHETVAELPAPAAPAPRQAVPSRFSRMGIVDDTTTTAQLDLDEILARRRAG
ncbi:hypothetical protein VD659_17810 [Herbiconiux sp. 11R-BC]|uniref:hypothetical protein n=1 Tax=Herbiconiux sp. 11R-BC TaxID=3111637 RepID=UPI003C10FEDC